MNNKGQWGSSWGFLLAAVGSAVGLGNLWGFPYKMGVGGGFAFLLMYLILAVLVGFVIMQGELVLGRKTGKGIIETYRTLNEKYTFLGFFGFIVPFLILAFYCVLGGYTIKYTIANFGDIFGAGFGVAGADPEAFFYSFIADPVQAITLSVVFIVLTALIVIGGVQGGIEKFAKIAMPALFVMLVIVIIRSVTLPGALEGLEFMFKPNFELFEGSGWISVLASAGGQMFFSLSLGMGIMITFGSYLPKKENIEKQAVLIPIADTMVAIMAGMAIMPAVFAMGFDPAAGPGLLFVTLQAVFDSMGAAGSIFGTLFYLLVFIAAITSAVSLTEVGVSAIIDMKQKRNPNATIDRRPVALIVSLIVGFFGVLIAIDALGTGPLPTLLGFVWLDFFDLLSEGILMPLSALIMSLLIGWVFGADFMREEMTLEGNQWKSEKLSMICFKFIAPVGMLLVLIGQIDTFFGLGIFS